MNKRTSFFRGMSALMAFMMLFCVAGSTLLFQFSGVISGVLNAETSKTIQLVEGETVNTDYYTSEYGTDYTNKQTAAELEMTVGAEIITQAEEGMVLVRNENNALPLSKDSRITIFGSGSYHTSLGDVKESSVNYIPTMTVSGAMEKAFGEGNVNTALIENVYSKLSSTTNTQVTEAPIGDVTEYENTWESDYNDAAFVVITRLGGESNDSALYSEDGKNFLDLQQNEKDLLAYLQQEKKDGTFQRIIALINSDQMVELGWLEDYDVDACMLIGLPGVTGLEGLAKLVTGDATPSGHLVDTYAYNSLSAPATTYANGNMKTWSNVDEVNAASSDTNVTGENIDYYTIYAEGIYVGYKYYETRYEDCVTGSGNAASSVGSSEGGSWNYQAEVAYPFGYGLSYTTFEQSVKDIAFDASTDSYTVTVDVTNTGDVKGRSVVQVYAQTPYGDYEKENRVEKAAIQLVGFDKTQELEPGASTEITVEVDRYLLASYDTYGAAGYILSSGDYYLAVGDDSHDALNNILAAKGYSIADGMTADGNADKTYQWTQDTLDADSYNYSEYTGEEITNLFAHADLDYYGIDFVYLTRNDWEGTYPAKAIDIAATEQMITDIDSDWYETPADAPAVSSFTQGTDNGLSFVDMKDVAWEDEETWNTFLDQLTVEEMASMMNDARGTTSVDSIGLPSFRRTDDNMMIDTAKISDGAVCIGWCSEVMTSRTWNPERATERGRLMGIESAFANVNEVWYGGGNIHRTPFSGRNRQYYSEDGNFGYLMGALEAEAMQATGTIFSIKHFALNDQEDGREGISTFASEQAIREIYLRAFEGALTKGGALGVMASFNRIGVTHATVDTNLLTGILRGEWGFKGHVTTDGYSATPYKTHYLEMLTAGIDYSCLDPGNSAEAIVAAVNAGDGYILQQLREATKANVYSEARTTTVNGLSANTKIVAIVPMWEQLVLLVTAVSACAFAVFTVLYLYSANAGRKQTEKQED